MRIIMAIGGSYSINLAFLGSFILRIPRFGGSGEQIANEIMAGSPIAEASRVVRDLRGSFSLANSKVFALAAVSRFDDEKLPVNA
jgi:hypothetical protein